MHSYIYTQVSTAFSSVYLEGVSLSIQSHCYCSKGFQNAAFKMTLRIYSTNFSVASVEIIFIHRGWLWVWKTVKKSFGANSG